MRFGICCSAEEAPAALAAGCDYVELPASQLLDREIDYLRIGPEVTNLFFPGGYRIYGPERERALAYAQEVIEGASRIGVEVMVIGSAGARQAPSAEEVDQAETEFVRFAAEVAEIARIHEIVIAPESLNRGECNVGVDLGCLARDLASAGVAYTADSFHVLCEWNFEGNEAGPDIEHWRNQIPFAPAHVHVGNRKRLDPQPGDPDLVGFVQRLAEVGYDGRISLECRRFNDQSLPDAIRQLKELFSA